MQQEFHSFKKPNQWNPKSSMSATSNRVCLISYLLNKSHWLIDLGDIYCRFMGSRANYLSKQSHNKIPDKVYLIHKIQRAGIM